MVARLLLAVFDWFLYEWPHHHRPACFVIVDQRPPSIDPRSANPPTNTHQHHRYVPYGRVGEVVPYLIRRAQENSDVLGGVGKELGLLQREIRRRILPF